MNNGNYNCYVVYGKNGQFISQFELSSLNGTNGFVIDINAQTRSVCASYRYGPAISILGDINGDGINDIIIGAAGNLCRAEPSDDDFSPTSLECKGQSYIIFGNKNGFNTTFNVDQLDGSNGFVVNGINYKDGLGTSVSDAGDINNDGFSDIIMSAPCASPNANTGAGQYYIIFGQHHFHTPFDLLSLNGTNGVIINGIEINNGNYGSSVNKAGDINGDGITDVIIGAPGALVGTGGPKGQSYIIFGHKGKFISPFELSSIDGSNGFIIDGINYGDGVGWAISGAGDINGDGYSDAIIGAPWALGSIQGEKGQAYVIFGYGGQFPPVFKVSLLNGKNGFIINGINYIDESGWSVSDSVDFNADGIDDIIIGAPYALRIGVDDDHGYDYARGQSYIIFGHKNNFVSPIHLKDLNGVNGFTINGIHFGDKAGISTIQGIGDINHDGIDDLMMGTPFALNNVGQSYILFGTKYPSPSPTPSVTSSATLVASISPSSSPENNSKPNNFNDVTLDAIVGTVGGAIAIAISVGVFMYGKSHGWWCAGDTATVDHYHGINDGDAA